ncbi:hypothetical protein BT96DRAFT_356591 [Gymnopus androsaceus JB14]|uniref:Uncharacterized protein n=1 Tax=Gymnopus androsaceus JB14 TaxID=1447944 RepID=A0A6A4I2W5_9AGAR|nr:hypothetical protein BT96DRAFT_356591 [Gymnopus androsaceus JB14]
MSLKLPTLFTASNNVFWISKDGVQRFSQPASSIMTHHLDLLDLSSRPWSLVDAHRDAPAPSVALFANPLFPIYATLPNVTRYKQWVKDQRPMTHIMQPWDWDKEDWLNCMKLFDQFPELDQDTILEIKHHCGPLPRDIWGYIGDRTMFKNEVERAADALDSDAIYTILRRMEDLSETAADLASHKLLIVRRLSRDSTDLRSDAYEVDFKSTFAEELLRKRFSKLVLDDAERLFRACSLVPEASVFGGWIFEAQAMK